MLQAPAEPHKLGRERSPSPDRDGLRNQFAEGHERRDAQLGVLASALSDRRGFQLLRALVRARLDDRRQTRREALGAVVTAARDAKTGRFTGAWPGGLCSQRPQWPPPGRSRDGSRPPPIRGRRALQRSPQGARRRHPVRHGTRGRQLGDQMRRQTPPVADAAAHTREVEAGRAAPKAKDAAGVRAPRRDRTHVDRARTRRRSSPAFGALTIPISIPTNPRNQRRPRFHGANRVPLPGFEPCNPAVPGRWGPSSPSN